jgi:hypothetical protein
MKRWLTQRRNGGYRTTVVVHEVGRWKHDVGLLAAGVFGGGCLIGAVAGIGKCWFSFSWGFDTLELGICSRR